MGITAKERAGSGLKPVEGREKPQDWRAQYCQISFNLKKKQVLLLNYDLMPDLYGSTWYGPILDLLTRGSMPARVWVAY